VHTCRHSNSDCFRIRKEDIGQEEKRAQGARAAALAPCALFSLGWGGEPASTAQLDNQKALNKSQSTVDAFLQ